MKKIALTALVGLFTASNALSEVFVYGGEINLIDDTRKKAMGVATGTSDYLYDLTVKVDIDTSQTIADAIRDRSYRDGGYDWYDFKINSISYEITGGSSWTQDYDASNVNVALIMNRYTDPLDQVSVWAVADAVNDVGTTITFSSIARSGGAVLESVDITEAMSKFVNLERIPVDPNLNIVRWSGVIDGTPQLGIISLKIDEYRGIDGGGSSARQLSCEGFDSPVADRAVKVKKNRVIPFKARLVEDANNVDDLGIIAAPAIQVTLAAGSDAEATEVDALSPGTAMEGNQFAFVDSQWQFNLDTKHYTAKGTYTAEIVSGDASEYTIAPSCTGTFVVQ